MTLHDSTIIAAGRAAGWVVTHHDVRSRDGYNESIQWLRFRAACAREEMLTTTNPSMCSYLMARASQADAEALRREMQQELMMRAAHGLAPTIGRAA